MLETSALFEMDDTRPELVDALLEAGDRLDLVVTHVQHDENQCGSEAMRRLPLREVASSVFVIGSSRIGQAKISDGEGSRVYEAQKDGNIKHVRDSIIVSTAIAEDAVLVTMDRGIVNRLGRSGDDLEVWDLNDLALYLAARGHLGR